jgi:hypothetical protein
MTTSKWEPIKVRFCDHRQCEVALEIQAVYPPDIMPDQAPRILGHRCSLGISCNMDSPSCIWSGTNPAYDPFLEK